jgi:hypothetical protein
MKPLVLAGALIAALAAGTAFAQPANASLGSVTLARKLMADGKPLAAGTYQVRLTTDTPKAAPGQSPDAERYVEFLRGGKVEGRELATVVSNDEIGQVLKGAKLKPGTSKVEMLKGGDFWRVWINKGGTNYIINMPPAG